jgi:hypothetical protein
MHSHGHGLDILLESSDPDGFPGLIHRKRAGTDNVREDVSRDDPPLLKHHPDLGTHFFEIHILERFVVVKNLPPLWEFETEK